VITKEKKIVNTQLALRRARLTASGHSDAQGLAGISRLKLADSLAPFLRITPTIRLRARPLCHSTCAPTVASVCNAPSPRMQGHSTYGR